MITNTQASSPSIIPDSQPLDDQLDNEIATIRAQITALTRRRSILRSTLLSSHSTQSLLKNGVDPQDISTSSASALRHAHQQAKHNQLNLYRMCAGATMFRVRDPDPNAVDNGKIYGVRIEVFSDGKFLPPYYIFLNHPHPPSSTSASALRIHRHTIPPCIPLPALAAKYLPQPPPRSATSSAPSKSQSRPQSLPRLVRELRREIVAWHLRESCIRRLRAELGLNANADGGTDSVMVGKGKGGGRAGVKDIRATDAEGLDIRIEWDDGRVGRVRVSRDGRVEKAVVFGEKGRERGAERVLVGGGEGRVEGLGGRLMDVLGLGGCWRGVGERAVELVGLALPS